MSPFIQHVTWCLFVIMYVCTRVIGGNLVAKAGDVGGEDAEKVGRTAETGGWFNRSFVDRRGVCYILY